MKKFRVALVTALVLLVSVLCLVACGGVTGTYKFDSLEMTMGATVTTVKAGEEFMGQKVDADSMTLTLNSDNTCKIKVMGEGEESGEWKEEDGKIVVTVDGVSMSFKKDGSKLIVEESEMGMSIKYVLKK